jgi:fructose-1,6-bisphosphatase I
MPHGTTLTRFISEDQRRIAGATGNFTGLPNDVARACKAIANPVNERDLAGALSEVDTGWRVSGESQRKLELIASDVFDYHQEAARDAA